MGDNHLRKKIKQRKREYVRREKESIKRQKKEFRKKIKARRRRNSTSVFLRMKLFLFPSTHVVQDGISTGTPETHVESEQPGLIRYIGELRTKLVNWWKKRRHRWKQKSFVRKEIRNMRMNKFKSLVWRFAKNPWMIWRLSDKEKRVRRQRRIDFREYWYQQLRSYPSRIVRSYKKALKVRREKMEFARLELKDSLSPIYLKDDSGSLRAELFKVMLNSTVIFIIAFWVMYFTGQMATILTAELYSIPSVLYPYRTYWPLYTYSSLYTRQNLIIIFGVGPLACLMIAFLVIRLFKFIKRKHGHLRLLLLWMGFHGINLFFGAYVSGVITRTGFVYSSAWIFYSMAYDIEEVLFMVLSILALIAGGFFAARYFIMASVKSNLVQPNKRGFYLLAQVLMPWLLGTGIIYLTNYPHAPLAFTIILVASALMVLPVFINFNSPSNRLIRIPNPGNKIRPGWMYFTIFVALTLILRLVVYSGIRFG